MSGFSRLTGVVFEPTKTFEDIARRPTFLLPLALVVVFGLVFFAVFSYRVGWERTIRTKMESSSQTQQLSAEQREKQIEVGAKVASIGVYAGVILGTPAIDLAIAGVLLGLAAGMMSAPITFKQVFAVVCWSNVVTAISMTLAVVVMFLKNPEDFDLNNPLMFNLGALFELTPQERLVVFGVLAAVLIGLGVRAWNLRHQKADAYEPAGVTKKMQVQR